MGKRLEPASRPAGLYNCRRPCSRAAIWKVNGRPVVRANRMDKCHVHWQRSARPGKEPCARAVGWLRDRGHSVSAGQSRVRRCAAAPGNRARAS